MENFVVSARKYRPVRFGEVVGQESVTTTLQNAIKSHQIAHAYLFCGPRGVGKTTCARIMAREVNEFKINDSGEASTSLNIYELDAASNNSVEDIRNLVDQVRVPPQTGKYKVYIIDEVHMLSSQAFNAFLKTLEEPPPYAIFILATTEKQKILPTILSRCQIFDFNRITVDDISGHLLEICDKEGIEADKNALHIIAQKADGALRDALSMFDRLVNYSENKLTYESVLTNLNILDYDYYFTVTDHLLAQDHSSVLLVFDEIIRKGFDGGDFIIGLADHFRNLMVCKDPRTIKLMEIAGDLKDRYMEQAALIPASFLLNALNLANLCEINYKTSNNRRLHVELTLMKMSHLTSVIKLSQEIQKPQPKKKSLAKDLPQTEEKNKSAVPDNLKKNEVSEVKEQPSKVNAPEKEAVQKVEYKEEAPLKVEEEKAKNYSVGLAKEVDLTGITGTISLSDLDREDNEESEEEKDTDPVRTVNIEIDKALFEKAWSLYLKSLEKEQRLSLHHVMSVIEPVLNGGEITLKVENKLQKELFDNEKTTLVDFLEDQLKIKGLSLLVDVDKKNIKNSVRKPFTAKEKFTKMVEKNPALLTLKEKFDLKLEH